MEHTRWLIVTVIAILLASSCRISAQPWDSRYYVYLSEAPAGGESCSVIFDSEPVVREIYVFVATPGASYVEFSAPLPDCLIGATYLSDISLFPLTIGDSQTGIRTSFQTCLSGSAIHVLTINVMMQGLTENCCSWTVLPHSNPSIPGKILFIGCESQSSWIVGMGRIALVSPYSTSPIISDPSPADGAGNRALDSKLECKVFRCDCTCCALLNDIYFGTNPDPPVVAHDIGFPFDPGPLQPGTTYYWKVKAYGAGTATSPVWSFSTGNGSPTQSSSWGAIKALYREYRYPTCARGCRLPRTLQASSTGGPSPFRQQEWPCCF